MSDVAGRDLLGHGVELPFAGYAFQRVRATIVEGDLGAGDQILHRAGAEHLAGRRERAHACRDVHRDAADLALAQLDLAGVQSGADVDALTPQLVANAEGAADAPGWSVECRENSVARGAVELAAVLLELRAHQRVMGIEHGAPASVAELHRPVGRSDHVREEHRREHAVRIARGARPCYELFYRVEQRPRITEVDEAVGTG